MLYAKWGYLWTNPPAKPRHIDEFYLLSSVDPRLPFCSLNYAIDFLKVLFFCFQESLWQILFVLFVLHTIENYSSIKGSKIKLSIRYIRKIDFEDPCEKSRKNRKRNGSKNGYVKGLSVGSEKEYFCAISFRRSKMQCTPLRSRKKNYG